MSPRREATRLIKMEGRTANASYIFDSKDDGIATEPTSLASMI